MDLEWRGWMVCVESDSMDKSVRLTTVGWGDRLDTYPIAQHEINGVAFRGAIDHETKTIYVSKREAKRLMQQRESDAS